jgi:hypothetical protein
MAESDRTPGDSDELDELRTAVTKALTEEAARRGGEVVRDLILQEFVLVAHRTGWDSEGERISQVQIIPVDGASHRILGLLCEAEIRFQADVLDDYTDL